MVTSEDDDDSEKERPIVYYNKKMYVREDFRNMLSQGIEITPDNLLWSKDVTKLLKVMKQSVKDEENDVIDAHVIEDKDIEKEVVGVQKSEVKKEEKLSINLIDSYSRFVCVFFFKLFGQ